MKDASLSHGVLTVLLFAACFVPDKASAVDEIPNRFLSAYCWDCHSDEVREGDRRLDNLPLKLDKDVQTAERWQEVMHQLQLDEMPPSDASQPPDEERQAMIEWVREFLKPVRDGTDSRRAQVTHRRLNRDEYRYTIRDIFGFNEGDFDPTRDFPADNEADGFRNNGAVLQTSAQLIEQYFTAADLVLGYAYDIALRHEDAQPSSWILDPDEPQNIIQSMAYGIRVSTAENGSKHISLAHGLHSHNGTYDGKLFFKNLVVRGVPHSGWYDVTIEASGANRRHPYGNDLIWSIAGRYYKTEKDFYDQTQPVLLGIGRQQGSSPQERTREVPNYLVVDELPDNRFVKRTYRVWLDRGSLPYAAFVNGPPKGVKMQFVTNQLYKYDKSVPKIKPEVRNNLTHRARRNELYYDRYRGPEVQLRRVELQGPLPIETPHPVRRFLFANIHPARSVAKPQLLRSELQRIASTLFRRPVSSDEVSPYAELVESRISKEIRYYEALRPAIKAMLCSPEFLFLTERHSPDSKRLLPHEVASRLSYFLTSSAPGHGLADRLTESDMDNEVLREEAKRLLQSERGSRFFRHFTEQWLGLTKLGSMPPGTAEFPEYYIDRLEEVAPEQTRRFFAAIVRENRPVTDLVEADFTFVNDGLAKLYDLPAPPPQHWQRVSLPVDSPRRGLAGHASVMTVTADGVDTSPVVRSVWLLEKLFGTPTSPPPPDVPPIEPDIRGAKTIRQRLEKHREVKACAACHDRIDPLGYSLENFDPIGRFRKTYEDGATIDTSGNYRGDAVESVNDVSCLLVQRSELLTHNLAQKMLTYALGRRLQIQDQDDLETIIEQWKNAGLGMRTLVELIVTSEPFRSP